jgi:hypothetical protein
VKDPRYFMMKLWSRCVTSRLLSGLGSTAFFMISIAILAGACNHQRLENDGSTTASAAVSRLSQALVGERIIIRGKLLLLKCGQAIELEDGEVVCLEFIHPKSVSDDPYDGMYEKRVAGGARLNSKVLPGWPTLCGSKGWAAVFRRIRFHGFSSHLSTVKMRSDLNSSE